LSQLKCADLRVDISILLCWYMSIITGLESHRKGFEWSIKLIIQLNPFCTNGTAVEVVCVTGAASRVIVLFVSSETVPVASQYGAIFGDHGARELLCYRGTSSLLIDDRMFICFVSCQGNFANIVTSKLPNWPCYGLVL